MRKLFYAAIGAALTLASASPALAQSVADDLQTAIDNRVAINESLGELAAGTTVSTGEEAVLGEQALPDVGVDAPIQVKLDMLAALRADAAKNRALGTVPFSFAGN